MFTEMFGIEGMLEHLEGLLAAVKKEEECNGTIQGKPYSEAQVGRA